MDSGRYYCTMWRWLLLRRDRVYKLTLGWWFSLTGLTDDYIIAYLTFISPDGDSNRLRIWVESVAEMNEKKELILPPNCNLWSPRARMFLSWNSAGVALTESIHSGQRA